MFAMFSPGRSKSTAGEELPLLEPTITNIQPPRPDSILRYSSYPCAKWLLCSTPTLVILVQLSVLLPIFAAFAFLDWMEDSTLMTIGGSFEDNFTQYDAHRWASPEHTTCQWTEGVEYCESRSYLSFDAVHGGVNLSANTNAACSCSHSNIMAGHLKSKAYYLYGKLTFEAALVSASNGTMACVASFSELSQWSDTTHDEMTFCWFNSDDQGTVHVSWWTGDFLHEIVDYPPVDLTQFHSYEMEWSIHGFVWRIDGELWYARGNSSVDCGFGSAFAHDYFVKSEYTMWDDDISSWSLVSFFSNGTRLTKCDFSSDVSAVFEQPIQFIILTRPFTTEATLDADFSANLRLRKMRYTAFDEGSEAYAKLVDKWSQYPLSCSSQEGSTLVDNACKRSWWEYKKELNAYTKLLQITLILVCFGMLMAYLLRLLRACVGRSVPWASCPVRPCAPAEITVASSLNVATKQRKSRRRDIDMSRWTSIGFLGYLFRDLRGWKRLACYWGGIVACLILASHRPRGIRLLWDRLSLLSDHATIPSIQRVLASQIVCLFVVMQVFHVVALAVAGLPKKLQHVAGAQNDPDFVARIGYIVPCHKSEKEIGRTVQSILQSGIDPKHVVVIDNANSSLPPDNTSDVVRGVHEDIKYIYVPIGHKTNALYVGVKNLPASVEFVVHLDDDTIVPGNKMIYDKSHFDDPRVAAVSYGIEIERTGAIQSLVDFEFRLWSHWRYYRARTATAWYCHGIIGMWRRNRFELAMDQHPCMPFGEDGWLGAIVLCDDQRIEQELRSAVTTFAPERLFPTVSGCLAHSGRSQGYGASSIWKQRSQRWFCNAPRRLLIRAFLWLCYDAGTIPRQLLFRVEILRHVALTFVVLLYPIFVARVAFDGAWKPFFELKLIVLITDYMMYFTINYIVWPAEQRVHVETVLLYPLYRLFLRLALVVGHWRCVLWYMPNVEMRTCRFVQPSPTVTAAATYAWLWNRLFETNYDY